MLIRNSALYTAAKLLPGLFGLATTAALTRLLEPEEYGLYGLALVVMTVGSMVLFEWLGLSFLRFGQSRQNDAQFASTFVSMFVVVAFASAILLGAALAAGVIPPDLIGASLIGLLMIWASAWFELVSRMAVAEFQPIKYLTMNFARSFLVLVGATSAAWLTESPLWTAIGTGTGVFISAFIGNTGNPRPSWRGFDRGLARDVLIFGAPMAVVMVISVLIDGANRILLERLDSAQALGVYTAASILAQSTLGVMATGISAAGYSLVVREVEGGDHPAAHRQLLANGTLLLAVVAPASLGIALTGNCIATTLVGSKFAAGVAPLMVWMAASSFLASVRTSYLDQAFQLAKKPYLLIWSGLAGIVGVGLSVYLIPREGPVGAAIAATAAQSVALTLNINFRRYAYPVPLPIEGAVRVGFCCLAMALVVIQLPNDGWTGLILRAVLGCATYAIAAIAVNLLESRDRATSYAKSASRRWTAFRDAGALKNTR